MKVLMVGTKTCHNCKRIRPNIEEYCLENSIEFQYYGMTELSSELIKVISESNIKQAPVFFISRGDKITLVSGDDIFVELKTLN